MVGLFLHLFLEPHIFSSGNPVLMNETGDYRPMAEFPEVYPAHHNFHGDVCVLWNIIEATEILGLLPENG